MIARLKAFVRDVRMQMRQDAYFDYVTRLQRGYADAVPVCFYEWEYLRYGNNIGAPE